MSRSSSRSPSPSASPASLTVRHVGVSLGGTTVLADVSFVVDGSHRVGLVGPNGVGKTTLLRVLAHELTPERGRLRLDPPTATVARLTQEPSLRPDETVLDHLARRTGVAQAAADLERWATAMADDDPASGDAYAAALDRYLALGGPDFEARAARVGHDLGLPPDRLADPTTALSGGQAARLSLAAILLTRADLLLLDEPTNDLDLDGLARLERFVLDERSGGLVVVSHDRAFLERVVTRVVDLDDHTRTAAVFDGGWQAYVDTKAAARRQAEEAYAAASQQRAVLVEQLRQERQRSQAAVAHERRKASDNDKFIARGRAENTERRAHRVRSLRRSVEKLDEVTKPWEGWQLHLELATAGRSGDVVARLDGAVVERGRFRLGPLDLEIRWADRLAVTGPNGSGKTTLLGALLGTVPLSGGRRWLGPSVVPGHLDQGRRQLLGPESLLAAFQTAAGVVAQDARSVLAKLGLGADDVRRPASTLSPGERTRAALALLMARGTNLLVLDEPTNHLDLPAIEQLEAALDQWPGTLVLVSHDRRLVEAVRVDRRLRLPSMEEELAD